MYTGLLQQRAAMLWGQIHTEPYAERHRICQPSSLWNELENTKLTLIGPISLTTEP